MAAPNAIWAIDIGQCALKALHARLADDCIEIEKFVTIPHDQILSQPDADEPALIRATLEKFTAEHQVGQDPLVITVPGHRSFARFSKLPPVEDKKIPDIVLYEATQQIPFGIDEVVWDYQIFRSDDSPDLEVGIFAIKRSIVAQYLEYFHEINLYPVLVQTAPIALYNACVYEGLVGEEANIIADVGAQNTNFLIAEGHRLWLRNIPLGGNNFTEALQKSFKLKLAKAEQLKRSAATSKYARAVFQSMRPVFSDLSAEFQRSIGYYTSLNRESQAQRLYALGNAFLLPGLVKFLQQNLGVPVSRVDSFNKLKLTDGLNEPEFSENTLTFAVAYGLAVQGLGQARVKTDLMPPEIARAATWRKKSYWFAAAAACLVLGAGAVWLKAMGEVGAIKKSQATNVVAIESILGKYDGWKRKYNDAIAPRNTSTDLVDEINRISQQQATMPKLMEVLTSAVPEAEPAELASAKTLAEYRLAAKNIDRYLRRQIFITGIQPQYKAAITPEIIKQFKNAGLRATKFQSRSTGSKYSKRGSGGPMGGMGQGVRSVSAKSRSKRSTGRTGRSSGRRRTGRGAMGASTAQKGLLVTINGMTPFHDAPAFIENTLIRNLRTYDKEYSREHNLPFWIEQVTTKSCSRVMTDDEVKAYREAEREAKNAADQSTANAWSNRPSAKGMTGAGPRKGISGRSKTVRSADVPIDPMTDEVRERDSEFTVTCVVYLGKAPAPGDKKTAAALGQRRAFAR